MTKQEREVKKRNSLIMGDFSLGMDVLNIAKRHKVSIEQVLLVLGGSGADVSEEAKKHPSNNMSPTVVRLNSLESQVAQLKEKLLSAREKNQALSKALKEKTEQYETEKTKREAGSRQISNYRKQVASLEERLVRRVANG